MFWCRRWSGEEILPGDVFGGLVVHAVLDVFHGEEVRDGDTLWSKAKMDGKLSYRGIRSGRDMGGCELNSSTRAKEPTGRDWVLYLGAAKMEPPRYKWKLEERCPARIAD